MFSAMALGEDSGVSPEAAFLLGSLSGLGPPSHVLDLPFGDRMGLGAGGTATRGHLRLAAEILRRYTRGSHLLGVHGPASVLGSKGIGTHDAIDAVYVSRPDRSTVPGRALVKLPASTISSPFTSTWSIPFAAAYRRHAAPGRS